MTALPHEAPTIEGLEVFSSIGFRVGFIFKASPRVFKTLTPYDSNVAAAYHALSTIRGRGGGGYNFRRNG